MEIRIRARQGQSLKQIARDLGVSINTVRRYIRQPEAQRYGPRAARPCKLDAFKAYLEARVAAARPHWIPATVLLRELQARGYTGGVSQLKAWLAPMKAQTPAPVVRYETAPGVQMQADFTTIRRGREPLKAFVATLGFSRATAVRFTENETSATLLACLEDAFAYFGGVPQEVLFDNMAAVITERDAYGTGRHRWHGALLSLAEHYGFKPRVCRPYRAQTKGKVERFNGYLKGSFVVPLAASLKSAGLRLDVTLANAHVGRWLDEVAHRRVHGTTGETPLSRLELERGSLLPLPARRLSPVLVSRPLPLVLAPPYEGLQHPLTAYDALLEVTP